jgi:glutamate synthase domain-containing protein 2
MVQAFLRAGDRGIPDFITVDGAEGGTGAAPPEFSNSVGTPLTEGLTLVHGMLQGAGIRRKTRIICSGKVLSGFHVVRNLCLGADLCNAARGMMFALGCIMALKCNTNHCPTGIATQDEELIKGLVPDQKATRVYSYHKRTIKAALEIVGATGVKDIASLTPEHLMIRDSGTHVTSYANLFPKVDNGSLLIGKGPPKVQKWWDAAESEEASN